MVLTSEPGGFLHYWRPIGAALLNGGMAQPTLGGETTTCPAGGACAAEIHFALNVEPGVSAVALGHAVYVAMTSSSFQARAPVSLFLQLLWTPEACAYLV